MKRDSRIYLAGHNGMVGSAILRQLNAAGCTRVITRTHAQLDLTCQAEVAAFFAAEKPEYVFLAAARVGGIVANNTYPAEFIHQNLAIQTNVIHESYVNGVKKLLFLGSSCIYPRECPQPIRETYLLTGPLESTNEAYAVAKIAGIKLCQYYNRQYGTSFISAMPTNLYGPRDNYDLEGSHVLPALIRKFHLAKCAQNGDWTAIQADEKAFGQIPDDFKNHLAAISRAAGHPHPDQIEPPDSVPPAVLLWGTGTPRREFLHVDDLARACMHLMRPGTGMPDPPLVNIGCGQDVTIKTLAEKVASIVGFSGDVIWDSTRPDGTPRKLLDISRIESLGWSPSIDLDTGIRQTYTQYQEAQRTLL